MSRARDRIESELLHLRECGCEVNCATIPRLPNTTSLYVPGVNAADLVVALDLQGVLTSTGAACSSGKRDPSHVLLAMGQGKERASSTIRISVRADITEADVQRVINVLTECIGRLRTKESAKMGISVHSAHGVGVSCGEVR